MPSALLGSGASAQNKTDRCGLRPHRVARANRQKATGLTEAEMQKTEMQWLLQTSSGLRASDGRGCQVLPQLCWDGNAAPSPQAAGGGHRVSLAWPRTELITGLVRRPSPKLETCPTARSGFRLLPPASRCALALAGSQVARRPVLVPPGPGDCDNGQPLHAMPLRLSSCQLKA